MATIDFVNDASTDDAPAGFFADESAIQIWATNHIANDITFTIDVGYGECEGSPLGAFDLGESNVSTFYQYSYEDTVRPALVANLDAQGYTSAAADLPATITNDTMNLTESQAMALGLSGSFTTPDGYIGITDISGLMYWGQGKASGSTYSAMGTFKHEITEDMGRVMDNNSPADLFRFASDGVLMGQSTYGGYLSVDGGETVDAASSGGAYFDTNHNTDLGDWASGTDIFSGSIDPDLGEAMSPQDFDYMKLTGYDFTGQNDGDVVKADNALHAALSAKPTLLLDDTASNSGFIHRVNVDVHDWHQDVALKFDGAAARYDHLVGSDPTPPIGASSTFMFAPPHLDDLALGTHH